MFDKKKESNNARLETQREGQSYSKYLLTEASEEADSGGEPVEVRGCSVLYEDCALLPAVEIEPLEILDMQGGLALLNG